MSEIAGDEDLPEDFFCFRRIHAGRCERQFFRWETEDVYRKTSEFLPYCSHPVCLKLFLKQINVYLLMMLMEIHRPVTELTESDAADGHVTDCMVEDKEGVECSRGKLHGSSAVVPCVEAGSDEIPVKTFDCPCLQVAVHADAGHVVSLFVELDFDAVKLHLYMMITFNA